jgi:hypothetical protein
LRVQPVIHAVVNYASFCHSCLHTIQGLTNVLAVQQSGQYKRHRPETTLLYQLIEQYYPDVTENLAEQGKYLPKYVEREFDNFLRCGRLEYGFLRVVFTDCKHEKLVAFSCKRKGFCPSCGARRMAESAALLVDVVLCS